MCTTETFLSAQDETFFNSVVEAYHSSGNSIRETAAEMDISRSKVRKVLITMGEITSDITEKALPYLTQGRSQKEIADILGISVATLSTYLPYGNRVFNREERTDDAIRSEEYRERQKSAASRQVNKFPDQETYVVGHRLKTNTMEVDGVSGMNGMDYLEDDIKVLKLRLELQVDEYDREVLRKFGKAKEGISREIIVPSFYPLFALHYAIQKAFGWQNSHLHHFEFPDEVFANLTEDSFVKYCKLCGLFFRFPYGDEEMGDIYWNDDYSAGKSFKTWLKRKYSAPYSYGGTLEHFMFSQVIAKGFWDENATVRISPSFAEYRKGKKEAKEVRLSAATCQEMKRFFECGLGELIERASISNFICSKPGNNVGNDGNNAYTESNKIADDLDKQFEANFEEMKRVLAIKIKLDEAEVKRGRISKRKNASALNQFFAMSEAQKLGKEFEDGMNALLRRTDVAMPPLCKELTYKYDYGDNWIVKITCEAEYVCGIKDEKVIGFYTTYGKALEESLFELIFNKCVDAGNPVCIAADGLPVMDDVGGVSGYCDFLRCIKNGEDAGMYDDPESSKDWARGMGWNGRMSKAQNIL